MAQAPQLRAVPTPAATPAPLDMWPITGDAPDIRIIVQDQAATIQAQANLIAAYQGNLQVAQHPPAGAPATGSGTTTGTSTTLTVASAAGGIVVGSTVSGSGIPTTPATIILGQISGTTGGNGTYLTNYALSLATATALTFTPPPPATPWPIPNDALTMMEIQQTQTAILRVQSALIQHYQDLLNQSQTPAPPTGP